ncbi:MAG: RES family NAD+ phosphorylase [Candidatus Eremiobacteraeota bacterium]|nr:RES family NAD+ phosphorylase [Candidatus Eremiobacteraeota bacterium]
MQLFRIARRQFVSAPFAPFDGEGAYRGGSRWNSPGHRMSFASLTLSLSMLEYLVHIEWQQTLGDNLVLVSARLDAKLVRKLKASELPSNWQRTPRGLETRRLGDDWLESRSSVALAVPSAVVPIEQNILINPLHRDFSKLFVQALEPFQFDTRLMKESV